MNEKFPVLSTISSILKVLGGLMVLGAIVYVFLTGIYEPNLPNHYYGTRDYLQIVGGLLIAINGLIIVAFGEIIGVLFAIEKNTRPT